MDLSQRTEFCQYLLDCFEKFCFSLKTSYKELIWCTNDSNTHIPTFCKRWSFILRCFFPESILKQYWQKQLSTGVLQYAVSEISSRIHMKTPEKEVLFLVSCRSRLVILKIRPTIHHYMCFLFNFMRLFRAAFL